MARTTVSTSESTSSISSATTASIASTSTKKKGKNLGRNKRSATATSSLAAPAAAKETSSDDEEQEVTTTSHGDLSVDFVATSSGAASTLAGTNAQESSGDESSDIDDYSRYDEYSDDMMHGEFGSQQSRFSKDHVGMSKFVKLKGLFLAYPNGEELLDHATLQLGPHRRYGLVG
jgi:hypothetical protein